MKKIVFCLTLLLSLGLAGQTFAANIYTSSEDFLQAEGNSCSVATDGCNTVQIWEGKLGAMTQMYCENIYGENGQEQWQCIDQKLEDETLGFMNENQRMEYKNISENILDMQVQERVVRVLENFSSNVLERVSYDTPTAILALDKAIEMLQDAINTLALEYPADEVVAELQVLRYNILTFAKYELEIIQHRWKRNSGME